VPIQGDAARLQQAFLNLALNAFSAMKPGGVLRIVLERAVSAGSPVVTLSFADQGCGIPAASLEKIFAPGYTTRPGSPGIGLAVTRTVIEQHGGSIRVESREGAGTSFMLTLPAEGVAG